MVLPIHEVLVQALDEVALVVPGLVRVVLRIADPEAAGEVEVRALVAEIVLEILVNAKNRKNGR